MSRVVSVWLTQFPIERLRRAVSWTGRSQSRAAATSPGDEAAAASSFALVEGGQRGVRVTAVNGAAAAAGVMIGQSLADARAIVPGLRTRPAEPRRDAAALAALANWAGCYGPSRNTEGTDGLWIDITGVAHLFGGEEALLSHCRVRLDMAGYSARLGLADTVAAAWALARYGCAAGSVAIAPPAGQKPALADLPVEALRLTPATTVLLRRLGLYRVGELYGLPRASLARRFRDLRGTRGGEHTNELADGVVLRLDQALGAIREPRRPLLPIPSRLIRQVFAEPLISSAGIETAVTAAIVSLCEALAAAGEGARRLSLALYRTDGSSVGIDIGTSSPCRDPRHIGRLFAEKLGAIDLGFGVDVMTLEGGVVEMLDARQASLDAKPRAGGAQDLAELVDRLANRTGAAAIHRIAAQASHIPEQGDIAVPALAANAVGSAPGPALRPPFLLRRPEPIEVIAEVPEGPPRRFLWRRARHRIVKAAGPERIEPLWWQNIGKLNDEVLRWSRDYYRVEDDRGGRYWVFRAGRYDREQESGSPAWFVHGLFG